VLQTHRHCSCSFQDIVCGSDGWCPAAQEDITSTPVGQIAVLICLGVGLHFVYLGVNFAAATALRLPLPDFKAVLIMGSQKTLPISIAIISFLPRKEFGRAGLLAIPCIIGHVSQLFIDAFIAGRMAAAEEKRREEAKLAGLVGPQVRRFKRHFFG
jgi:predicted Na+-dependent transporter